MINALNNLNLLLQHICIVLLLHRHPRVHLAHNILRVLNKQVHRKYIVFGQGSFQQQLLVVDFALLYLLYLLLLLPPEHARVAHAVQRNLYQHAFCLHDDVVLQLVLLVEHQVLAPFQVQVLVAPVLTRLRQKIRTSELLYPPLQYHNQLVHHRTLLENNLVRLVVPRSHVLKKFLLVRLYQPKQLPVLLQHVLPIILKHHLLEILLPHNLRQRLPAQHLTRNLLLSPHRHLSYRVVVQRIQSKTLPFVNFALLNVPSYQRCHPLLYYVK